MDRFPEYFYGAIALLSMVPLMYFGWQEVKKFKGVKEKRRTLRHYLGVILLVILYVLAILSFLGITALRRG